MNFTENFQPDLIIEATNACNKQCQGCYAPNILVGNKISVDSVKNLDVDSIKTIWTDYGFHSLIDTISVRGGEPTLNPQIVSIMDFLKAKSQRLILETNGEWISNGSNLIRELDPKRIVVKLSADKMHGSFTSKVRLQLQTLDSHKFTTMLAITAVSREEFETFYRKLDILDCIPIFQKKAFTSANLSQPKIGVISASGKFKRTLTTINEFSEQTFSEKCDL